MSAVVNLHQQRKQDEIDYDDPVFFHRSQIKIGTVLKCHGRRDPNSVWRVAGISTYVKQPSGKYRLKPTEEIVHMDDQLWLERQGTRQRRQATFSGLSYSAIWRLAQ